jgi:peptide-methionine (R)-S-oxide reductase
MNDKPSLLSRVLNAAGLRDNTPDSRGDLSATSAATPARSPAFSLTDAQWRERLTPQAYAVLRHEATERATTSPLNRENRKGVFLCAGCDAPLFTSEMKFDSGTGWPSFFNAMPGAFETRTDHKLFLARTEYHCARCGGHHGHVFDDGPAPTGLRYCNNGVALKFVPQG